MNTQGVVTKNAGSLSEQSATAGRETSKLFPGQPTGGCSPRPDSLVNEIVCGWFVAFALAAAAVILSLILNH